MSGHHDDAVGPTSRARRRIESGWLDVVYIFLFFEAMMMLGVLLLIVAEILRLHDLLDPRYPIVAQALQWLIWFAAPFALVAAFIMRVPAFPTIYAGMSLLEHLAMLIPALIWGRVHFAWDHTNIIIVLFIMIDVAICLYLFRGTTPRRVFASNPPVSMDSHSSMA